MAGYKVNGTDLDSLLEPWQSGDGYAAATGYKINGSDLNTKYAPASVGAAFSGTTGYDDNGTDIGPRFCAKGQRITTLPINGQTYTVSGGRGTSSLTIVIQTNGMYAVIKDIGQGSQATLASGPWLPSGDSVSSYTVQFTGTAFISGTAPGGGTASYSNGAPTPTDISVNRSFTASASATTVGTNALQYGDVEIQLFKSGNLRSDTTITFDISAAG